MNPYLFPSVLALYLLLYLWVLASVFLLYLLLYLCCACFCICALQLGNAENSDWEKVSWQLKHQPQLLGDDDDDDDDVVAQSKHAPYASSSGPYAFFYYLAFSVLNRSIFSVFVIRLHSNLKDKNCRTFFFLQHFEAKQQTVLGRPSKTTLGIFSAKG